MKQNGTDPKSPSFFKKIGMLTGFITEVATEIFYGMSEAELQHHLGKKEQLRKDLRKMFDIVDLYVEEKETWRKFYQKHFSLDLNFADVIVPEKPAEGKWRLLFIAKGLTLSQVFESWKFPKWRYDDNLDKKVPTNKRTTAESYAIWVRDEVEPDAEFLDKSTNQADPDMTIGVTLLERMIHELDYFSETNKHIDPKGVTFCSGSRDSGGDVPSVYWCSDDQEVSVGWYDLDDSDAKCGIRHAVSL